MNRRLSFPPDDDYNDTVIRYENFLSGTAAGYFDVEELEIIVDYYLRKGQTKDSAKALEFGLVLHPQSTALQTKRAKVYLAVGDFKKAFRILDTFADTNDYELTLLKIEALLKLGRNKEATLLCQSLLEDENAEIDNINLDIAYIYFGLLNFESAIIYLNKGDEFNPRNIDLLFELGFCYEQLSDREKAIETYNRIIDIDSFIAEAWFNMGQVYFSMLEYNKALNAYDYALTINEDDTFAILQKAHTHFQLGQYEIAVEGYLEYEKEAFDPWQAKLFIGECYEKLEKYDEAIAYYQRSLVENPDNYDALTGIGICCLEQEKFAESIDYINKALELYEDASDAWVYLAEGLIGINDNDNALLAYLKSITLDPEQPDTIMSIANICMDKGEFKIAMDYYEQAYAMDAGLDYIHLFMAVANFKLDELKTSYDLLKIASQQNADAQDLFFELCPEATNNKLFKLEL
jgi:tetratricopeptide (TPR) repeat protein